MTENARRALEILQALGRSSTAKYEAMAHHMDPRDWRVRGGLLYHGASTGRWSGSGVQPHNFPKGAIKDMDGTWDALMDSETFPHIMETLSHGLRGAITAGPGQQLYVADYAAIEARVLLWLAEDDDALEVFRQGKDIYLEMAREIYGYECNKTDHPLERSVSKIATLALGFQMGWTKFVATLAAAHIEVDETFGRKIVEAYRAKFWRVKEMWYAQEDAAVAATKRRGSVVCGRMRWVHEGRFLYCILPNGRRLAYPDAALRDRETPWGAIKQALTYKGIDTHTRKWARQTSYGGLLVENQTQAVARDLMAEAMLRCEASGTYRPVLTVHDEIVCEADQGAGSVAEFDALIAHVPDWAAGCPVAAESWNGFRYRK